MSSSHKPKHLLVYGYARQMEPLIDKEFSSHTIPLSITSQFINYFHYIPAKKSWSNVIKMKKDKVIAENAADSLPKKKTLAQLKLKKHCYFSIRKLLPEHDEYIDGLNESNTETSYENMAILNYDYNMTVSLNRCVSNGKSKLLRGMCSSCNMPLEHSFELVGNAIYFGKHPNKTKCDLNNQRLKLKDIFLVNYPEWHSVSRRKPTSKDLSNIKLNDKINVNINIIETDYERFMDEIKYIASIDGGNGTFGIVHAGYHVPSTKYVAIKDIDDEHVCLREANMLKQLNHQNIVSYVDCYHFGEFHNYNFLVLSLADRDLRSVMYSESGWRADRNLNGLGERLITDIFPAVRYLNTDKKVIHFDIKPANILLSQRDDFHLILADFGSATALPFDDTNGKTPLSTYPYFSSDYLGGPYDEWDVFSLGIVLYELVEKGSLSADGYYDEDMQELDDDHKIEYVEKFHQKVYDKLSLYDGIDSPLSHIHLLQIVHGIIDPNVSNRSTITSVLSDKWVKKLFRSKKKFVYEYEPSKYLTAKKKKNKLAHYDD